MGWVGRGEGKWQRKGTQSRARREACSKGVVGERRACDSGVRTGIKQQYDMDL